MNLKEAHTIVKNVAVDKNGYVSVLAVARILFGHQAKHIMSTLTYDDELFLGLRMKGDISDVSKWQIERTDAVDFVLRIVDYSDSAVFKNFTSNLVANA